MSTLEPSTVSGPSAPVRHATYGLVILTLINGVNYLDRYIIAGVMDQIQTAFHATGAVAGLVATVFVVVYMLAAPIGGRIGDTGSRRLLIAGSVFLWSLATFASGLATTLALLLVARAFIGVGEAGYATVAPAIISDLYPRARRSSMLAVFYVALPVGSALGFVIGGWVGEHYSWHEAFYVGGVPGILLAVLSLWLPEPPRGASDGAPSGVAAKTSFKEGFLQLLPNGIFWTCTAGLTLMTFSIGGLAIWMPSFLKLERGMTPSRAGLIFGAITAVAGLLGTVAGGWLGDRANRTSPTGGLSISGVGLVVAAPFMILAAWFRAPVLIFGAIFVTQFLVFLNTGPLNAAIMTWVAPSFRAFAMGMNVLFIHLLGDAISPPLVGLVKDHSNLQTAIMLNAAPLLLGGIVLLVGARAFKSTQELESPGPASA